MFGYAATEIMGKSIDTLITEQYRPGHSEHVRAFGETGVTARAMGRWGAIYGRKSDGAQFPINAFESRRPFQIEYRLRAANGEYRWIYDSGTPGFSTEGEFLGFIGSCIDITDRKWAEESIKKAHAELNELKNQLQAENLVLQAQR